jgi:hypothetical protein
MSASFVQTPVVTKRSPDAKELWPDPEPEAASAAPELAKADTGPASATSATLIASLRGRVRKRARCMFPPVGPPDAIGSRSIGSNASTAPTV